MRLRVTLSIPEAAVSPAFQHLPERHSPVPYLFGGLAAMLGLIAFALLILACSYWKLSGYPERAAGDTNDAAESGGGGGAGEDQRKRAEGSGWENNVLVIMAGQVMPTFLATPSTSRSSSFGDSTASSDSSTGSVDSTCEGDKGEKVAVAVEDVGGEINGGDV